MSAESLELPNKNHGLPQISRRRQLLPRLVLIFTWIFLVFGAIVPIAVVMAVLKFKFQLSLLGMSTNAPLSPIGIMLTLFYVYKGVVAYALWTEKDWAIKVAKIDAILSIILCCFATVYNFVVPQDNGSRRLNFAIELIVIIPYLNKMNKIQSAWENFDKSHTDS